MKGIEKITQRINDQAQAEIDGILAAAQAQADLITQQGKVEAEAESAEMAAPPIASRSAVQPRAE